MRGLSFSIPEALERAVRAELERWDAARKTERLWDGDASLWTGQDESRWLGWLDAASAELSRLDELNSFVEEVLREQFAHVVLIGMGGSSLCSDVLAHTFGKQAHYPELLVLDSTNPSQILALEQRIDLTRTLFAVASKSGSTLEPNILKEYFFERVRAVGKKPPGRQFVAITDPGSSLEKASAAEGFRKIFFGEPTIGGRFSALSRFGTVPAALIGLDLRKLLASASEMMRDCGRGNAASNNPGVYLGVLLGTAAAMGRDKITLIGSSALLHYGAWLEQLLAESTGKVGKGLIPVDREPPLDLKSYGSDRLFVSLGLEEESDLGDGRIRELERLGHPVVRIQLADRYALGGEFFRWEMATAVAGSVLGINPFDQPDVEASKQETRKLMVQYEKEGRLPDETPMLVQHGLEFFADSAQFKSTVATRATSLLARHFGRIGAGDYFAVLAYLPMNPRVDEELQAIRVAVAKGKGCASCLGYGPRYLHSTGQAYKGGPNRGVFLVITADSDDLPVPGHRYTFGAVLSAQARGDCQVLAQRGRRLLRVNIRKPLSDGLAGLLAAVEGAFAPR